LDEFSPEEQKVLLALSHSRYRWRTRNRLLEVTGLDQKTLDRTLSRLISRDLVRPSFSKKKEIIFGLRERVDRKDTEAGGRVVRAIQKLLTPNNPTDS
jgi:DNA-binding MarR family transcriptional regulator